MSEINESLEEVINTSEEISENIEEITEAAENAAEEAQSADEAAEETENADDTAAIDNAKTSKAISIGVTIASIILIIAIIIGFCYAVFLSDYKAPVNKFFDGIENEDNDKFLKAFSDYNLSETAQSDNFAKQINDLLEAEYGANLEFDYEIMQKAALEEEALGVLNAIFETIGDGGMEIEKSLILTLELTITGDTKSETIIFDLDLARIKGEGWTVFDTPVRFNTLDRWADSSADDTTAE